MRDTVKILTDAYLDLKKKGKEKYNSMSTNDEKM